ncbi:MAG TPA: hypothetical protein VD971_00850 [Phycisphaerales bacterium]|nr:hypothetical protein [Phycisphaerales bacterium]
MFAKLVTLIVALGVLGCALLAQRQARLQAASEAAQAQLRIRVADERLLRLRARVAARVSPQQVEVLASSIGPLRPATDDPPIEVARAAAGAEKASESKAKGKPQSPAHRVARSKNPV